MLYIAEYCPDFIEDFERLCEVFPKGMIQYTKDLSELIENCATAKVRARVVDKTGRYLGHIFENGRTDGQLKQERKQ